MICEVCKQRDADIVFKTVAAGQVATRAMCLRCAKTIQHDMMRMFMLLGFQPDVQEEPVDATQPTEDKADIPSYLCTNCGRPFQSVNEQTMAGCAQCYQVMEQQLQSQLKDKAPQPEEEPGKKASGDDSLEDMASHELRYQLIEAVIKEDFETAARLRDQMKSKEVERPQDA